MCTAVSVTPDTQINLGIVSATTCFDFLFDSNKACPLAPPTPKELTATKPPSHGVGSVITLDANKHNFQGQFVSVFQLKVSRTFKRPSKSAGISGFGVL